jgi:hypothetical protein
MEFRDVIRQPAGLIVPTIMAVMVLALRKKPIHVPGGVLVDFFPCRFSSSSIKSRVRTYSFHHSFRNRSSISTFFLAFSPFVQNHIDPSRATAAKTRNGVQEQEPLFLILSSTAPHISSQ